MKVSHQSEKRNAVFLDRDGVLNKAIVKQGRPYSPRDLNELVIMYEILPKLKLLKERGYLLVMFTNQPDVARGLVAKEHVDEINTKVANELAIDKIYCCFHDDGDRCSCRKPKPGMLWAAAKDLLVDLPSSFVIGDRAKDVGAGEAAGCRTLFVDYGYDEPPPPNSWFVSTSVTDCLDRILRY